MWTVSLASMAGVGVYHGQWYLVVEGLPQGRVNMVMTVDGNSQPPIVTITDPADASRILDVEEVRAAGDSLTGRFRAMGVKLSLCLGLHDNRNATGLLMDHFSIKASKDKLFELEIKEGDEDKLSVKDTVWLLAPILVDCSKKVGPRPQPERYMNTTPVNHPNDGCFLNEQGLMPW